MRLRHGKDELEVGAFLNADDKSSFAKALRHGPAQGAAGA